MRDVEKGKRIWAFKRRQTSEDANKNDWSLEPKKRKKTGKLKQKKEQTHSISTLDKRLLTVLPCDVDRGHVLLFIATIISD